MLAAWSRQRWFDREFDFPVDVALFPETIERLRGTPARLEDRLASLSDDAARLRIGEAWSILENVGHLIDLEPLWLGRAHDLANGLDGLRPADLRNRATHEAGHNDADFAMLLAAFRSARAALVEELETFTPESARRGARHPRLGSPMTAVDLAFFVAEHDDHHVARIAELLLAPVHPVHRLVEPLTPKQEGPP